LGQNLGHGSVASQRGLDRYVNRLAQISGQRPGLLGIDLGYNHVSRRFEKASKILASHWEQGGLVTLSMHPRNPWRGTDCHDTHARNLDELFEKGTVANLRWIADLEHVASAL